MDNAAINEFAKSVKNNELISSFVDSYIEEHDLAISADLILGILDHLQKSSSLSFAASNLPQLFVQMGSFIDVLAALDKQTEDVEQIVERQVNKLGPSSKGKGAFHTLAENLKSELVRLMLDEPKKKSPPPPPPQKEKKKSGMEMSEMLKLGSKLLQGDGAGNIASLLGGEGVGQIASLLGGKGGGQTASFLGGAGDGLVANLLGGKGGGQIASFLQSGGARQIASLLSGDMLSNIDSSKIDLLLKMAMNYAKGTPWESYVKQFGDNALQGSGMFQKVVGSESGRRLLHAVPKIMSSKDLNSVFSILSKEAEWNWGKFFGNIDNSVYKQMVMYEMAGYILPWMDSDKLQSSIENLLPTLNSALVSRNMPLFDPKKPAQSFSAIVTKAMFVFGKKKINFEPYITSIYQAVQHAFHNKMKGIRFQEFSLKKKTEFIAESLDADIWLPLHNVWQTLERLGQATPACSSHLLCSVNRAEVLSVKEEGRRLVVEGASLAAAWIINQRHSKKPDGNKYWELYRAVLAGAKGEDCDQKFPSWDVSCNLVNWRSMGHMEL